MTIRALFRRRPAAATRYPADPRAVFILALAVVSGIPMLLFDVDPGTLDALLPRWAIFLWGLTLVVGCAGTLFGMSKQSTDGILIEQVGSVAVGSASVFYAAGILLVAGLHGAFSAGIVLGFGLSCFWRWGQLQALINQGLRTVVESRDEQE